MKASDTLGKILKYLTTLGKEPKYKALIEDPLNDFTKAIDKVKELEDFKFNLSPPEPKKIKLEDIFDMQVKSLNVTDALTLLKHYESFCFHISLGEKILINDSIEEYENYLMIKNWINNKTKEYGKAYN